MKTDSLKKHHFWILVGLAPVFVLLAVVFLMTKVSGAIGEVKKKNDEQVKKVQGTAPPGTGALKDIDEKKVVLEKKKDILWQENWDRQKSFFTWPKHPENLFAKYNDLKFGTDIDKQFTPYEFQELQKRSVYEAMFEEMAKGVAPTKFAGGWQSVLRWVRQWGELQPESKQLWLLMEDVWAQRAMLDPIHTVNESIARFDMVKAGNAAPPPLDRTFRSRVWDLDLKVVSQDGRQVFKVRLKNRTDRLQLLGAGNQMQLKVWTDPRAALPPSVLSIEGEFVPGSSQYPAPDKDTPDPWITIAIPPGVSVAEIAKVEQVLDDRTVPVRQISQLVLGYPSAKQAALMAKDAKTLEPPKFWTDEMVAAEAPAGFGGPGGFPGEGGAGVPGGPPGGVPGGFPGGAPPVGEGGPGSPDGGLPGGVPGGGPPGYGGGAAGGSLGGGTTVRGAANANRKRYASLTDQVRRMPVALTLVVDQMYVQDVLIAYANSPLRFEAVQYHWKRLNRPLNSATPVGTPGGFAGGPGGAMGGKGGEDGGAAFGFAGGGLTPGGPPGGFAGGPPGGFGAPPLPEGPGGTPDAGGPGGFGSAYGGFGGSGMFGFGGFSGFGGLFSNISDAQANAGLVELSVYGLVSLYEKYEPKKEGEPAADPAAAPAPMGDTPAPMGTAPAAGAAPATATPAAPAPGAPTPDAPPASGTPAPPPAADPGKQ